MKKTIIILLSVFVLTSCGTIVNDANIPVSLSFSDGSDGKCKLSNKRAQYSVDIPSTTMVRRSDDALRFDCVSVNGKKGFGSIPRLNIVSRLPLYSRRKDFSTSSKCKWREGLIQIPN